MFCNFLLKGKLEKVKCCYVICVEEL